MRTWLFCIISIHILILSVSSEAAYRRTFNGSVAITSLPFTCNFDDTMYVVSVSKLTSASSGINLNGKDRILITASDTTDVCTLMVATGYAIGGGTGGHWQLVRHLTLMNDSTGDSTTKIVKIAPSNWWLRFENCNIYGRGYEVQAVINTDYASGYGYEFYKCRFQSRYDRFWRRDTHNGSAVDIELAGNSSTPVDSTTYLFRYCRFDGAPHVPLALASDMRDWPRPRIEIVGCTLIPDVRNNFYNYGVPPATSSLYSSGDGFGIDVIGIGPGSRIDSNFIPSGTLYEGGQGILLQGLQGSAAESVFVRWNTIIAACGPNEVHAGGLCTGIYYRFVPDSPPSDFTGSYYNAVRDNSIVVTIDRDTATTYRGSIGLGMSIIISGYEGCFDAYFQHNDFMRNTVIVDSIGQMDGAGDKNWKAIAMDYGAFDSTQASYALSGNNQFKYNHYKSPRSPLGIANNRGYAGNHFHSIGDTIEATANHGDSSGIVFNQTGAWITHSRDNTIRDAVWLGSATDAKRIWSNESSNDTFGLSLLYQRTAIVTVLGSDGLPFSGATVWVKNAYNQEWSGTSDANGRYSKVVGYQFKSKDLFPADTYVLSDSTGFNSFLFKAKSGTDSVQATITLGANVCCDTLQLPLVAEPSTGNRSMVRKD